jgi:hypothetical protein
LRLLADIAIIVALAAFFGFATAWYGVENGGSFGEVRAGAWVARPESGGPEADPYTLAFLARTGEVPLGTGEGMTFTADSDDTGVPLDGRCVYRLSGQMPSARMWTLTPYNAAGSLMANAARRAGFHSREVVRAPDGTLDITVSSEVAPGNWLPIGPVDRFFLVFRLYDTPATAASRNAEITMPRITKGACQ